MTDTLRSRTHETFAQKTERLETNQLSPNMDLTRAEVKALLIWASNSYEQAFKEDKKTSLYWDGVIRGIQYVLDLEWE